MALQLSHSFDRPAYAHPHTEGAYGGGFPMPSSMIHPDPHMARMMPPHGPLPGYPMHHFMPPQFM
jgi:hypothetical protein